MMKEINFFEVKPNNVDETAKAITTNLHSLAEKLTEEEMLFILGIWSTLSSYADDYKALEDAVIAIDRGFERFDEDLSKI